MAHDFKFERGQSFGEWLHREMHEAVSFEDAAWAIDRARRVEDRLQAGRATSDRLFVEIPWMEEATAFTGPGRYIYFTRRLYELCPTDEQVAFVIGHEIAHHDLGHVAICWMRTPRGRPRRRFGPANGDVAIFPFGIVGRCCGSIWKQEKRPAKAVSKNQPPARAPCGRMVCNARGSSARQTIGHLP